MSLTHVVEKTVNAITFLTKILRKIWLSIPFTSHYFYADYENNSKRSNVLSIIKILHICMKCYDSEESAVKSSLSSVAIAVFQNTAFSANTYTIHAPLDVIKIHSKLILWKPSVKLQSLATLLETNFNFDTEFKRFKKLGTLINLETIPILIAMSHLNASNEHYPFYMPTILFHESTELPFVMWITEHFEFITCSALKTVKEQESAYLNVFDRTTWAMICPSVILSAIVTRIIRFCLRNPNPKGSFLSTKKQVTS